MFQHIISTESTCESKLILGLHVKQQKLPHTQTVSLNQDVDPAIPFIDLKFNCLVLNPYLIAHLLSICRENDHALLICSSRYAQPSQTVLIPHHTEFHWQRRDLHLRHRRPTHLSKVNMISFLGGDFVTKKN